ncbi:hypothetical protein AOLI_G00180410 [Acnodon oligacanthus]
MPSHCSHSGAARLTALENHEELDAPFVAHHHEVCERQAGQGIPPPTLILHFPHSQPGSQNRYRSNTISTPRPIRRGYIPFANLLPLSAAATRSNTQAAIRLAVRKTRHCDRLRETPVNPSPTTPQTRYAKASVGICTARLRLYLSVRPLLSRRARACVCVRSREGGSPALVPQLSPGYLPASQCMPGTGTTSHCTHRHPPQSPPTTPPCDAGTLIFQQPKVQPEGFTLALLPLYRIAVMSPSSFMRTEAPMFVLDSLHNFV